VGRLYPFVLLSTITLLDSVCKIIQALSKTFTMSWTLLAKNPKVMSFSLFLPRLLLITLCFLGYTEHSMKRGGASEAALHGASVEELRDAGHWTNVRTAAKYIADTSTSVRRFNSYLDNAPPQA